jgi:hypothetical protein
MIPDHSDGSTDQPVGAANYAEADVMSHSVEAGVVIVAHSAVAMDFSVGMNHSVVAVTTDRFVVVFAVTSHFAAATSEYYSEALSVADHSVVALATMGQSSVAVVTGHS